MITSDSPAILPRILLFFLIILSACKDDVPVPEKDETRIIDTPALIRMIDTSVHQHPDSLVFIYLTFDDGPYTTTPRLVSLLKQKQVKASFFMIGSQKEFSNEYDSIFQFIKSTPLFRIYNHTYSHAITNGRVGKYYSHPDRIWEDIERNKRVLQLKNNITRLPGMNAWRVHNKSMILTPATTPFFTYLTEREIDEQIIGWDFEWKALQSKSHSQVDILLSQIKAAIAKKGKKDIVILAHDYLFKTDKAIGNMDYFIESLRKEGNIEFKWIEDLIERVDTLETP
jgi:hypothetical protein